MSFFDGTFGSQNCQPTLWPNCHSAEPTNRHWLVDPLAKPAKAQLCPCATQSAISQLENPEFIIQNWRTQIHKCIRTNWNLWRCGWVVGWLFPTANYAPDHIRVLQRIPQFTIAAQRAQQCTRRWWWWLSGQCGKQSTSWAHRLASKSTTSASKRAAWIVWTSYFMPTQSWALYVY